MLTELQQALADAHALAIAAAAVTRKVGARTPAGELTLRLEEMHRDADDTRARCLELHERYGGELADELLARVNTTKEKAADLANAWFKAGTSPLAAWSFLAMGEAGEVAVWRAVELQARAGGPAEVRELAAWALPLQEQHLEAALDGVVRLAELTDPNSPRWG
jgi:hypothetical protein